jgi:hypothetical protein
MLPKNIIEEIRKLRAVLAKLIAQEKQKAHAA